MSSDYEEYEILENEESKSCSYEQGSHDYEQYVSSDYEEYDSRDYEGCWSFKYAEY